MVDDIGRRVLVPGGTGTVGRGVVAAYLAAGAEVVVPTRSEQRGATLRARMREVASGGLHTVVGDYSTFTSALEMIDAVQQQYGGVSDVVAPVGDLWGGGQLAAVTAADWESAFAVLARTHMAIARAVVPMLSKAGAYSVVVGQSARTPVPGLGLVSMEQAAVLMMQRVLAAEHGEQRRLFALILGQVVADSDGSVAGLSVQDIGAVAVALSLGDQQSAVFDIPDHAAATELVRRLRGT